MSTHDHIVIEPIDHFAEIMRWLKSATAVRANRILNQTGEFWAREYYDRWLHNEKELRDVAHYLHWNPVRARLVAAPGNYPWSSLQKTGDKIAGGTR